MRLLVSGLAGLVIAFGGSIFSGSISQAALIVPQSLENTPGGLGGVTPFSFPTTAGIRTQLVYDASLFSSLSGPQSITAIRFRPIDPAGGFFGDTLNISNVRLQLSTTSRSDERNPLSVNFADNVGADAVTIFTGPLSLTTAGFSTGPTGPFDYLITLQTPFVYDPARGNLLLDTLVNPGESVRGNAFFGSFPRFDTTALPLDGIASLTNTNLGSNPGSGDFSSAGPVTQFELTPAPIVPIPEPSTFVIVLGGALTAFAGSRLRRRTVGRI